MKKSKPSSAQPSYGLHKRSGQAYARVLDAGGNRRMIYLGRHGSPESHRLFAELSEAVHDGTLELFLAQRAGEPRRSAARRTSSPQHDGPSIKEVVARYLCWAEGYYQRDGSPTTELASMRGAVETLLNLFDDEAASAFHVGKLKLVRQALIDRGKEEKGERGFTRTYVNGQVHRIRRVFRWAVEERLVPAGVLHELQALRSLKRGRTEGVREGKPKLPVSEPDFRAVLTHVSKPLQGLLEFMWWTGARCCEASQLCTRDVNMTGEVWQFRPRRSKTEHHASDLEHLDPIAIGPRAQKALQPFVKLAKDEMWFSPKDALVELNRSRRASRTTPLLPSQERRCERDRLKRKQQRGDPDWVERYVAKDKYGRQPPSPPADRYETRAVDYALQRACKDAGVSRWSVHQLRHAALTRIRLEFGAEAAVAIGRHSDASVTGIYTRDSKRRLAASIAQKSG